MIVQFPQIGWGFYSWRFLHAAYVLRFAVNTAVVDALKDEIRELRDYLLQASRYHSQVTQP